ncbi:AzlD domain-containing protein [Aliisedimentitalea scapharcae]|uniref:AzlD domain-containing protein n=1 Tax=Aliisedimentitalea scapharcae TaxID=1524259 RepID=A0ABZ2XUX7_9RHOB|nr:AzlD domain-containing protein [Rhodobacteraceae bacterium M382]
MSTQGAIDPTTLWIVIICMAVFSFALRFVFIGFMGDRPLPAWLMRHLRYTAVAIIPALVAPLVLWPTATQGETDPPRLIAALATLTIGLITRNVMFAIATGAGTLFSLLWLMG